jgi:acyl carrier protein
MEKNSYSKEDIFAFVKDFLLDCGWISEDEIELKSRIDQDLVLDDCDFFDLIEDLQDRYHICISDDISASWVTIEDIVASVYSLLNK